MPIVRSVVTVLICQLCGDSLGHVEGTDSPLPAKFFIDHGWTITDSPDGDEHQLVCCPRCKPILDTTLANSDERIGVT